MNVKNIGTVIYELRKTKGITQDELAKRMGYKSKSTINKIELGINDIPQSKIVKFADVLGTTPAHLMGWSDDENQETQSPDKQELTEGEKLVLELFRKIPEEHQPAALEMLRAALKMQKIL